MNEDLKAALRTGAAAKVNLGLFVGAPRADGMHELVSVMQSVSLADELTLEPAPPGHASDLVVCPDVPGPPEQNLAARALERFRAATGWQAPPLLLQIEKRIPIAAGLAGGSTDAAAALRLAAHASALEDPALLGRLAAELGADVTAALTPGRWLASATGSHLEALPDPIATVMLLILPLAHELSTAAVYSHFDELGKTSSARELEHRHEELRAALEIGAPFPPAALLHNDLQAGALDLCPQIAGALEQAGEAGADAVFLSGSGPTVVGLFAHPNPQGRLARALAGLADRQPPPIACETVGAEFGAVRRLGASQLGDA
jgi:4-diphosphocytidyl-2-C-methyl-D-erythritol kinase